MRTLLRAFIPGWAAVRQAVPGVLIAIALAALARAMAQQFAQGAVGLPKIPLSPVMCAVLLGMLWRNTLGVPGWATSGLNWTMHRLLRVLAAFDVVEDCGDGKFQLTAVGQCLRADAPNSVAPLVLMCGNYWQGFASLGECIKTGKNAFELLFGLEHTFLRAADFGLP